MVQGDSNMIGADAPALRGFASNVSNRLRQIEEARGRLSALIESVPWVGDDRERFLGEWQSIHSPGLVQLVADLTGVADKASRHATEQENTSSGGGGGW
jgi:hypothetical protein